MWAKVSTQLPTRDFRRAQAVCWAVLVLQPLPCSHAGVTRELMVSRVVVAQGTQRFFVPHHGGWHQRSPGWLDRTRRCVTTAGPSGKHLSDSLWGKTEILSQSNSMCCGKERGRDKSADTRLKRPSIFRLIRIKCLSGQLIGSCVPRAELSCARSAPSGFTLCPALAKNVPGPRGPAETLY